MFAVKKLQPYMSALSAGTEEKDIMSDVRYIKKSCSLITEALQKGCDVMHMPNGDIIITEVKTFTYQYSWDEKKGKMVRVQTSSRNKKAKADDAEQDDVAEFEDA
jgi:hypothetical protein